MCRVARSASKRAASFFSCFEPGPLDAPVAAGVEESRPKFNAESGDGHFAEPEVLPLGVRIPTKLGFSP